MFCSSEVAGSSSEWMTDAYGQIFGEAFVGEYAREFESVPYQLVELID